MCVSVRLFAVVFAFILRTEFSLYQSVTLLNLQRFIFKYSTFVWDLHLGPGEVGFRGFLGSEGGTGHFRHEGMAVGQGVSLLRAVTNHSKLSKFWTVSVLWHEPVFHTSLYKL